MPEESRDGEEAGGHPAPYRLLAEMASDVAMEISADSRVVWISPSIEDLLGWSVADIVGTSIFERMHPDDVGRGRIARDEVMSGSVVRNDLRFLAHDGTYRWMSARLAPVHDALGNVVGRVAGWHDVSAEYALRDQLRLQQEQFRLLAENASDIVVRVDPEGRLVWVSPSVHPMLGWTPEELVGRGVTDIVLPADLQSARATQLLAMSGRPVNSEARILRKDGGFRWMAVSIRPVFDDHGAIVGRVAGWRDIDQERQVQEQHRHTEALYRMLAENSSDVVLSADVDGTVRWISPSIADVTGWAAEDIVGRTNDQLIHPDDLPIILDARVHAARGETGGPSLEVRYLTKDGRYLWMSVAGRPVLDELGNVIGRVTSLRNVDAEHRIREQLAKREAQYRALAENSSDVVLQSDAGGVMQWLSPSVTEQLGWLPEELVGTTSDRLMHPDDAPIIVKARALTNAGMPARFEARYRSKRGEYVWFSVAGNPLLGADGEVVGRVVGLRNIDAEIRARTALAASEERFRFLVENANDVVVLQVEGIPVFVSPAITRILGWDPDELVGQDITSFWHLDDQDAALRLRQRSMAEDGRGVMRMRHKDGSFRWIEVSASPVTHPDGRAGAVGVLRDVTARVAAEERLADLQERDAMLASMSSDVFLVIDHDGAVRWASGASKALLGESNEELVGARTFDSLVGLDADAIADWRAQLEAGEMISGLAQVRREDLEPVWIDFRAVRGQDSLDPEAWAFVSIRDAQAEMDFRVALEASEREAKEANLAKTAFLSRMSHELRTPLNAVLGFAQLMQLDDLEPAQLAATEQIIAGGRHLLDLINEVLDIARIESGRMSMSPEAVQAADVITESLDLVRGLASTYQIDIERFEPSDCGALILVDRQRTIQILLNLLSNAVKYNRAAGGVRVRCERAVDGMVRIEVEDDGPGIAPELMDRVFEPFDRLGAESKNIEGTGIGLALSRGLAEMMHGRLEVASTPGIGTVFTLVVPGTHAGPNLDVPPVAPEVTDAPDATTVVMYVEDNPANAMLMRSIVERLERVELREASTGEAALEWAAADPPDLVLLDLHLPDLPGEDVLRRLRTDPRTATVPVVVISADAAYDVQGRLGTLGADGFLPKPVDIGQILEWIESPLRGRGAHR